MSNGLYFVISAVVLSFTMLASFYLKYRIPTKDNKLLLLMIWMITLSSEAINNNPVFDEEGDYYKFEAIIRSKDGLNPLCTNPTVYYCKLCGIYYHYYRAKNR